MAYADELIENYANQAGATRTAEELQRYMRMVERAATESLMLPRHFIDPQRGSGSDRTVADENGWFGVDSAPGINRTGFTTAIEVGPFQLPEIEPKSPEPTPQPAEPEAGDDVPQEYVELATELGISNVATEEACLIAAIREHAPGVYDPEKVNCYLIEHCPLGKHWCWKPLRERDKHPSDGPTMSSFAHGGMDTTRCYSHAVPYPVLLTVKKILAAFSSALFYVSDYEVKRPDPFLMVTSKALWSAEKHYIIERWDEPGFRE